MTRKLIHRRAPLSATTARQTFNRSRHADTDKSCHYISLKAWGRAINPKSHTISWGHARQNHGTTSSHHTLSIPLLHMRQTTSLISLNADSGTRRGIFVPRVCVKTNVPRHIYICIFYIINCHPGLHKLIFSNVHTYSHSQNLLNVPESAQVFHRTFSLVYSQTGYDTDVFSA